MNIFKEIEEINKKLDFLVSYFNKKGENSMIDLSNLIKEIENAVGLAKVAGDKIKTNATTKEAEEANTKAVVANLHLQLSTAMANLSSVIASTEPANVVSNVTTSNVTTSNIVSSNVKVSNTTHTNTNHEGVLLNIVHDVEGIPHFVETVVQDIIKEVEKI